MEVNAKFAEATTQIAFSLQLTKRQCNSLLRLASADLRPADRMWVLAVDGLMGLERKGLVFWHQDERGEPNGFGGPTAAGRLVTALLMQAGLTVENTNTPLVTKRVARLAASKAAQEAK